jgi:hypothetical protein
MARRRAGVRGGIGNVVSEGLVKDLTITRHSPDNHWFRAAEAPSAFVVDRVSGHDGASLRELVLRRRPRPGFETVLKSRKSPRPRGEFAKPLTYINAMKQPAL